MSIFTRTETRDITAEHLWGAPMSQLGTSGKMLGPVYGAVRFIGDQWSAVPLLVTERRPNGEDEPIPTPQILDDPDPYLDEIDWRFQFVASLKLRGNAYGLADPSRRFVRWAHPDTVEIDESNPNAPIYRVNGREERLVKRDGNLIHIRDFVQPGSVKGLSPIQQFAATFEIADLARAYGRRWFKNSSIPPAILQAKATRLDPDKLREARDDFIEAAKEGKPVALPGEWDWKKIAVTPEEAQFLQTIEATATDIAVIFGVPPEEIGGKSGSSRTYSNREMDQTLFNTRTLLALSKRAAQGFRHLIGPMQTIRFDLEHLAQPGVLESARSDTEQLRNGTLTLDEARARRGRRKLTDAEKAEWQQHYATTKSESESIAESISTAITKEA